MVRLESGGGANKLRRLGCCPTKFNRPVSEAYFGVLRAQDNLLAAKAQERALARQLEQTRQRFNVGLIAITDVYEAEARHDLAGVTRIIEENNVAVARERLSVLTGQSHGQLLLLSDEFTPEAPTPSDRSAWVDFALANNYELAAVRFAEEAARQTQISPNGTCANRQCANRLFRERDNRPCHHQCVQPTATI